MYCRGEDTTPSRDENGQKRELRLGLGSAGREKQDAEGARQCVVHALSACVECVDACFKAIDTMCSSFAIAYLVGQPSSG